jgi:predicted transcriptional regulator
VEGGDVKGILRRSDLVRALAEGHRGAAVGEVMSTDCRLVSETDSLMRTVDSMRESHCATVPVLGSRGLAGILTLENVSELIMVRSAGATAGHAA